MIGNYISYVGKITLTYFFFQPLVVFQFKLAVLNNALFNVEIKSGTISILDDHPIPRRRRKKKLTKIFHSHFLTKKKITMATAKKFLTLHAFNAPENV